jgi:NADH:ubiquinone oxidoreductase subunit 5 (subunit L)/multisubunit Na+/H+ antiporter MnhA subunit
MSTIGCIALAAPLLPALAFFVMGAFLLFGEGANERFIVRFTSIAFTGSVLCSLTACVWFLGHESAPIHLALGEWFGAHGYGFEVDFLIDSLSAPMMATVAALCGLIGRFSSTYLVREPGQPRFYLLLCLFATGMLLLVMAGSLDLLIAGWELVGVSSMLLIAFFHERTFPVRNALRAFVVYRTCDIGLLVGTVLMHHYFHSAGFAAVFGPEHWATTGTAGPDGTLGGNFDTLGATLTCLCLLFAAMGKSALFPLGSWLPRAMEGPTPSSAIFYGALSVHAGAYLLLRVHPLLDAAPVARGAVVVMGLATALHGTLVARVQNDVKSQLAYATTTQVGVIFIEIGLGFPRLALLHITGHAFVRTLQLLRAPNALQEALVLRANALRTGISVAAARPAWVSPFLYQLALERFYLDTIWERSVARPLLALSRALDGLERKWFALLTQQDRKEAPTPPIGHPPVGVQNERPL